MNLIVANKYYEVLFEAAKSIMVIRWKESVFELTVSQYKKEMFKSHEFILDLRPKFLIHDGTSAVYPPTDSLYQWTVDNISPLYEEAGLEKIAYVYPHEEQTTLFLKNLVSHARGRYNTPQRRIFKTLSEALSWLSV